MVCMLVFTVYALPDLMVNQALTKHDINFILGSQTIFFYSVRIISSNAIITMGKCLCWSASSCQLYSEHIVLIHSIFEHSSAGIKVHPWNHPRSLAVALVLRTPVEPSSAFGLSCRSFVITMRNRKFICAHSWTEIPGNHDWSYRRTLFWCRYD